MKTVLKISIFLNLIALSSLIFITMMERKSNQSPPVSTASPNLTSTEHSQLPPSQPIAPPPFHWSQLDANDYHAYVKNLRGIGCPEPTVRAIVNADVASVYKNYRRDLEQKLSCWENSSWSNQLSSFNAGQGLKVALQKIPDEEASTVADLLGVKTATVTASSSAKPVAAPLVLRDIDLSALNLNENQKQLITNLRQNFLQKIGGPNQNPDDPAYLARWQQAQPEADAILKGMIGTSAFQDYQLLEANAYDAGINQAY